MDAKAIVENIISLKNKDEALRNELIRKGELSTGYNEQMEALHNSNARELSKIIDDIGYPTIDKVGKEASEAAWLIIQHAISQPGFMKKCAVLLAAAVKKNEADPKHFAYLTDRIAVFEGKAQRYATQFDWDENGEMSPMPCDDVAKVNQRRKSIGLHTLEEQTQIMRRRSKSENQFPPTHLAKRQQEYNEWRKKVGWVK